MDAAAHNPAFAKKVGVPLKVAKEFSKASKGQTFKEGGNTMATKSMKALFAGKESKAEEAAEKKRFPSKAAYKKAEAKYEGEKYARGGGIEVRGKTKGKMITMKRGGKCK